MRAAEPSLTAKRTAVARGEHRLLDAAPWVLDDPFALMLAGPDWRQIYDARAALHSERVRRDARAWVVARSRYAEDRLEQCPFTQYVLFGAGLDSFAWRRPDLLHTLPVFEVDHPATQAWKRERVATLALPISDHHVLAPVDFETQSGTV
jgi:methyltransferase (TIGR00027 family)